MIVAAGVPPAVEGGILPPPTTFFGLNRIAGSGTPTSRQRVERSVAMRQAGGTRPP
jgi:hypothetical protein